ncbi:hypothetical protein HDU67_003622, partial [Dinochytrium kinnereticum]
MTDREATDSTDPPRSHDDYQRILKQKDEDIVLAASLGQSLLKEVEALRQKVREYETNQQRHREMVIENPFEVDPPPSQKTLDPLQRQSNAQASILASSYIKKAERLRLGPEPKPRDDFERLRTGEAQHEPGTPDFSLRKHQGGLKLPRSVKAEKMRIMLEDDEIGTPRMNPPPQAFKSAINPDLAAEIDNTLIKHVRYLQQKLTATESSRMELLDKMEFLERSISTLKRQNERYASNEAKLSERVWELEMEDQRHQETKETSEGEANKLKLMIRGLQSEITTYKEQLESIKGSEQNWIAIKDQLSSKLENEINSRRRMIITLQREKADLNEKNTELMKQLELLQQSRRGLIWQGGHRSSSPTPSHNLSGGVEDQRSIGGVSFTATPDASPTKRNNSLFLESLSTSLSHAQMQNEALKCENSILSEEVAELKRLLNDAQESIENLEFKASRNNFGNCDEFDQGSEMPFDSLSRSFHLGQLAVHPVTTSQVVSENVSHEEKLPLQRLESDLTIGSEHNWYRETDVNLSEISKAYHSTSTLEASYPPSQDSSKDMQFDTPIVPTTPILSEGLVQLEKKPSQLPVADFKVSSSYDKASYPAPSQLPAIEKMVASGRLPPILDLASHISSSQIPLIEQMVSAGRSPPVHEQASHVSSSQKSTIAQTVAAGRSPPLPLHVTLSSKPSVEETVDDAARHPPAIEDMGSLISASDLFPIEQRVTVGCPHPTNESSSHTNLSHLSSITAIAAGRPHLNENSSHDITSQSPSPKQIVVARPPTPVYELISPISPSQLPLIDQPVKAGRLPTTRRARTNRTALDLPESPIKDLSLKGDDRLELSALESSEGQSLPSSPSLSQDRDHSLLKGLGQYPGSAIEGLTSAMIGAWFQKYNRFGKNPQLRFFWVDPYRRCINWADAPLNQKRKVTSKSAYIEDIYWSELPESHRNYPPNEEHTLTIR